MSSDEAQFSTLQAALAGRFSIERELGRGGMGIVYLARDVALDRPVAIKVLPPALAADPGHRERFLREARTAAGLAHPNIVPIHLVEARDDVVCFVMGYVAGETLGDRVRRTGPLKADLATRIVREVAWALAYAHGRGVVHRDVKPDNILLEHGTDRAMVTDFGIARVAAQGTISAQGEILGTLQYMPPEQAAGDAQLDGRSDLYALGVTAFYALTGRLPFESASAPALIAMHMLEPAPPVASLSPGIPPRLAEAVDRCLSKEPTARFATAEALADALGEVALAKAIPPSILGLREAAGSAAALAVVPTAVFFPGVYIGLFPQEWAPALALASACMVGMGALQLLEAVRRAVSAGYTPRDAAEAAARIAAEAAQERLAITVREQERKIAGVLSHPIGRLLTAALGAVCATPFLVYLLYLSGWGWVDHSPLDMAAMVVTLGIAGLSGAVALRPTWVVENLVGEPGRPRPVVAWANSLWDSRITRLLFRVLGIGADSRKASQPTVEQGATEVLLGRAAGDLFSALSDMDRDRLGDVPRVIRDLESVAAALRERRDGLERAIAQAGAVGPGSGSRRAEIVAELEAAEGSAEERLQEVVAALENLRLDLLRLRAGVGNAAEITGAVEAARQIGLAVAAELEGRAEAERIAGAP